MPLPYLNKIAEKTGKPLHEIETAWDEAKRVADSRGMEKGPKYWGFVTYLVKQKYGIKESLTLAELLDTMAPEEVIIAPAPLPQQAEPSPPPQTVPANADQKDPIALTARNYIGALFAVRDKAHQLHLATKSFSEHAALGDFYEGLIDLADEIAETVQGAYGVMDPVSPLVGMHCCAAATAKEFIAAVANEAALGHSAFNQADTFLHNLVDEVQALVFRTKYKLDNLS